LYVGKYIIFQFNIDLSNIKKLIKLTDILYKIFKINT